MTKDVNNFGVDIVLLVITSFFFLRGFFKGFLSTLFSVFGVALIAFLSWKLSEVFGNLLSNWLNLSKSFENLINSKISGTFNSVEELESAVSNLGILYSFLLKLLGDISFAGELTAGEILSPKLSLLSCRLIGFLICFVLLSVALKIILLLLNKFVADFGLGLSNRVVGAVLGGVEGILISMLIFFVLSALGNFLLNEKLLEFVRQGAVSNWLYQNLIIITTG